MDRRPLAFLAALLLHFGLFGLAGLAPQFRLLKKKNPSPIIVELDSSVVDRSAQKKLLIDQNQPAEHQDSIPESAKYFSNQNRKVLRETRARNGGIADLSRFQSPSLREEISADAPGLGQKQKSPLVKRLSPGTEAQRLDNLELAEGAENLLNTAESVHYSFYSRIYGSLAPVWQSFIRRARPTRALLPGNYTVVADLVLDTEGNLIGIEFHERSEISQFNEAVIASVGKVKKFPNPPKDLIAGKKEFRTLWSFTVNVGQNSLINVAPPQRIE